MRGYQSRALREGVLDHYEKRRCVTMCGSRPFRRCIWRHPRRGYLSSGLALKILGNRMEQLGYHGIYHVSFPVLPSLPSNPPRLPKLFNAVQKAEVFLETDKTADAVAGAAGAAGHSGSRRGDAGESFFRLWRYDHIFRSGRLMACPGEMIGVTGPVACGKSTFGRVPLRIPV